MMFQKISLIFLCLILLLLSAICLLFPIPLHNEAEAQAELGYYLFFDKNISVNHSRSCASCHDPSMAFTDGYRSSVSTLGENLLHNAPSLINTAQLKVYDWANPSAKTLEEQMQRPLFSHAPIELGLDEHETEFLHYLSKDSLYHALWKKAFPQQNKPTRAAVLQCLTLYEHKLQSFNAPYDHWLAKHKGALSASALQGMQLFFSDSLKCKTCHGGLLFTNAALTENIDSVYFNIGLYNVNQTNRYPEQDPGLYGITNKEIDHGKFKVPSLRNVAITAPYMHDGSLQTLEEVIDFYARGGRMIEQGPYVGDGKLNTNKHASIQGFTLSLQQKKDLIAFLQSLTDSTIQQQPWAQYPTYFKNRGY